MQAAGDDIACDDNGPLIAVPLYHSTSANCSGVDCNANIIEQPVDLKSLTQRYGDAVRI